MDRNQHPSSTPPSYQGGARASDLAGPPPPSRFLPPMSGARLENRPSSSPSASSGPWSDGLSVRGPPPTSRPQSRDQPPTPSRHQSHQPAVASPISSPRIPSSPPTLPDRCDRAATTLQKLQAEIRRLQRLAPPGELDTAGSLLGELGEDVLEISRSVKRVRDSPPPGPRARRRVAEDLEYDPAPNMPAAPPVDDDGEPLPEPPPSSIASIVWGDARAPKAVDTFRYVYDLCYNKAKALHDHRPEHPMFGPPQPGYPRLPLGPLNIPGEHPAHELSWHRKFVNLAQAVVSASGKQMMEGSCWYWVSSDNYIKWSRTAPLLDANGQPQKYTDRNGRQAVKVKNEKFYALMPVRLLCFLQNPTDGNWQNLVAGKITLGQPANAPMVPTVNTPFMHTCHHGINSKASKDVKHCINGIQHGFFGTTAENIAMKSCPKAAGRWCCPGHGSGNRHFCIFTDIETGAYLECRNSRTPMDGNSCPHQPNCFSLECHAQRKK
ncbi:MAG: hypothetical protein Q9206_005865 [Seirophora lacunosa]